MTPLRKALLTLAVVAALTSTLLATTYALTPGQRAAVLGGAPRPVQSWFASSGALPTGWTFAATSLATMYDATGKLTYRPNNVLTYSNTFSNAIWRAGSYTMTVTAGVADPVGGSNASTLTAGGANSAISYLGAGPKSVNAINSIWIRRRTGTGEIDILDPANSVWTNITSSVTSSWTQVYKAGATNTSGNIYNGIQLVTNGDAVDVYEGVTAAVTYEITPRAGDQVITTTTAYYGGRYDHNPATGLLTGLLAEPTGTVVSLYDRDLTNAVWTATNVTAAHNATGIDGVANSASTITASSAGGTILQSITLSSSQRAQSAFVKGVTVTGNVQMTMDGGSTWTTLSSSNCNQNGTTTGVAPVSSQAVWLRCSIPSQTIANPSVGFKFANNSDSIIVDFVDNENSATPTSPIQTTSAAFVRSADTITPGGAFSTAAGTGVSRAKSVNQATSATACTTG